MEVALEQQTIKDIESILDYLWKDEERHYHESDCPNSHIFLVLERLRVVLNQTLRQI